MPDAIAAAHLPGLLQLASSALPIGGFVYSQGLEAAVDCGRLHDAATAERWIGDVLHLGWARSDALLWLDMYAAWDRHDGESIDERNRDLLAIRETAELRGESQQTGRSLATWLLALPGPHRLDAARAQHLRALRPIAYPCAHALAAWALSLPPATGLYAAAWSLLENLTLAAVKLVPLGQDQGQALLRACAAKLTPLLRDVQATPRDRLNTFTPMLSLLSSAHESQYSRLFRS